MIPFLDPTPFYNVRTEIIFKREDFTGEPDKAFFTVGTEKFLQIKS
jgi:hypothetical protein